MNWIIRFGQWWEKRRALRRKDFEILNSTIVTMTQLLERNITSANAQVFKNVLDRLEVLEAEKQVPSTTLKEFNMLKVRLERIELLVGLKREPVITNLPDAPRIS